MPRRRDTIDIAEFDAEIVVFDPTVRRVHLLQGIDALVFDACDGTTDLQSIVSCFATKMGLPVIDVERLIHSSIGNLIAVQLLDSPASGSKS